jgi:excinuclease ABC subunit B
LDLPEVSLVAILDADKEGFLRSGTALVQTIGRAARHVNGRVIMYADRVTDSMEAAISETNRRRAKQVKYNEDHGIVPASIHKAIRDITDQLSSSAQEKVMGVAEGRSAYRTKGDKTSQAELQRIIAEMERQMKAAAGRMEFEKAAALRDEVFELKAILADDANLKPWERLKLLAGEK